jgi:chaperonin GroEL (HSP60 family)
MSNLQWIMKSSTAQLFGPGVRRSHGGESRRYNILAARLIAELVKSMLGPRGREKMFIDVLGEVTITKDCATLLRKIDVEHPAAKVLIEASNAVDNEVGDGTASVVIFAAALLEEADELLDMGIAPATIVSGYLRALKLCLESLKKIEISAANSDRNTLEGLAITCLKPKMISSSLIEEDRIARLVVDAVSSVADFTKGKIDVDDIKIEEKIGNSADSMLVNGIVIDKTIDNFSMPRMVHNAKILLINEELESKRTRADAEINVTAPYQIRSYIHTEQLITSSKVQHIINSGANVLFSQKGISDLAENLLSKANIMSIKRVKENDLLWIQKATNAEIATNLGDYTLLSKCLGKADKVYEKSVGNDKMVFVDGCKNPGSLTILLRANSKKLLDEYHRSALDVIAVMKDFIVKPSIVAGGGSVEMIISNTIRNKARSISGREQIVIQKFASALEEIPSTIARNAGMNIVDSLTRMRSMQAHTISSLSNGKVVNWYGIDAARKEVGEMYSEHIIEPTAVKEQIIKTAVEVSCLLIGVDDVLMAKPVMNTHTHRDGTRHSHAGGDRRHDHYFDKLGKRQRPQHHFY